MAMLPGWVAWEEGSRGESSQGSERPGVPGITSSKAKVSTVKETKLHNQMQSMNLIWTFFKKVLETFLEKLEGLKMDWDVSGRDRIINIVVFVPRRCPF